MDQVLCSRLVWPQGALVKAKKIYIKKEMQASQKTCNIKRMTRNGERVLETWAPHSVRVVVFLVSIFFCTAVECVYCFGWEGLNTGLGEFRGLHHTLMDPHTHGKKNKKIGNCHKLNFVEVLSNLVISTFPCCVS